MPESMDRTQQDEALRQARTTPDAGTRVLLLRIADRLSTAHPDVPFTESSRLALALRCADVEHREDAAAADAAEQQLLRHMPTTDGRAITRGEYALLLRARAGRDPEQAQRVADLHRQAAADYDTARRTPSAGLHWADIARTPGAASDPLTT